MTQLFVLNQYYCIFRRKKRKRRKQMNFYSSNHGIEGCDLKTAVLNAMPEDKGLYMPEEIPLMPPYFFENMHKLSFHEIAFSVAMTLLGDDLSSGKLLNIVDESLNFEIPLLRLDDQLFMLELFHGPTLAFKDVGARFMARLMSHFSADLEKDLTVLVATSGDTGSAVANAFYGVEGVRVVLLYPSKKVSKLQEQQLSTLDKNIDAIEVEGTFDDCQHLVKSAFTDKDLQKALCLTSANSINIARLLPQCFYYFYAVAQLKKMGIIDKAPVFSVPSGNLGNLSAGLIAKRMGLPVHRFIAACNRNDSLTRYLKNGSYEARKTVHTISNAMDVGAPSNFARIDELYGHAPEFLQRDLFSASFDDDQTRDAMRRSYQRYGYILDPHAAVGICGIEAYRKNDTKSPCICLGTAHPAKFRDVVENTLNISLDLPEALRAVMHKKKRSHLLGPRFQDFKKYLISKYA